jgi:hypothetical protein
MDETDARSTQHTLQHALTARYLTLAYHTVLIHHDTINTLIIDHTNQCQDTHNPYLLGGALASDSRSRSTATRRNGCRDANAARTAAASNAKLCTSVTRTRKCTMATAAASEEEAEEEAASASAASLDSTAPAALPAAAAEVAAVVEKLAEPAAVAAVLPAARPVRVEPIFCSTVIGAVRPAARPAASPPATVVDDDDDEAADRAAACCCSAVNRSMLKTPRRRRRCSS